MSSTSLIKSILLTLSIFILAACGTVKEVKVVETKNIVIIPPDELMVKCQVDTPPNVAEYVSSTWDKKEELLISYAGQQMKNLFNCNKMIDSLTVWKKEQLKLYPK